jgi:hypothetical protein
MALAPAAYTQPSERKAAPQSRHLYQVLRYHDPYERRYGFIDNTGKLVIDFDRLPKTTSEVREFHEGRALIYLKKNEGEKFTGLVAGYIDETGNIIIAPRFDYARDFSEGLAYVEREGFHGFIDRQGKPVINIGRLASDFHVEASGLEAREFHEGLAAVGTGRWAGPPSYNDNSSRWEGLWGYIDRSGKLVIKPQYHFADDFSEGLAGVVTNRQYGFINRKGEMVIQPRFVPRTGGPHGFGIGGTSYFAEGLACVREVGGLYGYIDKKGDFVIPPQFIEAIAFSEGLAWAVVNEKITMAVIKVGWIDKSGQFVITRPSDQVFAKFSPSSYSEGLVPFSVYTGEKFLWGYMDHSGVEVIKPQFDGASYFVGGIAGVTIHVKGTYVAGINTGYTDRKTGEFMEEVQGYINKKAQFIWKSK